MDCDKVRRLAARYLGERLAARTRRRVEEHVKACLPCTRHVRAQRALRDSVKASKPALPPPPGGLRDSIHGCMNCMDNPGRTACPRLRRRLSLVLFPLPGVD